MLLYFEAEKKRFWAATKSKAALPWNLSAHRLRPAAASEREPRYSVTLVGRPAMLIFSGVSYMGHLSLMG